MNSNDITQKLILLSDERYKTFSQKLINTSFPILGVRAPDLKSFAKLLAREDYSGNLQRISDESHEHIMLQGLIIAYAKSDLSEKFALLDTFVPKIDNWAVCDSVCAAMKFRENELSETFGYINSFSGSEKEFELRFFIVMILDHFTGYLSPERIFRICENVDCGKYYVAMAVAWLISVCAVKFPEQTLVFLKKNTLDTFTHNKAVQKSLESLRTDTDIKNQLRELKRR